MMPTKTFNNEKKALNPIIFMTGVFFIMLFFGLIPGRRYSHHSPESNIEWALLITLVAGLYYIYQRRSLGVYFYDHEVCIKQTWWMRKEQIIRFTYAETKVVYRPEPTSRGWVQRLEIRDVANPSLKKATTADQTQFDLLRNTVINEHDYGTETLEAILNEFVQRGAVVLHIKDEYSHEW